MMLAPDAWFLFRLAIQLLEVLNPEILLGNIIPKWSNKVKARQFTLLSSVNRVSLRTFQNNLSTAPGLKRNLRRTPRNHKRGMNNQRKMFAQTSVYEDPDLALTHKLQEIYNREEFMKCMFNI